MVSNRSVCDAEWYPREASFSPSSVDYRGFYRRRMYLEDSIDDFPTLRRVPMLAGND